MPRWDPRKIVPTPWMDEAACKGKTLIFFPERGEDIAAAKAICRECPVRLDCLDHAMTHKEVVGVWGGLSAHERRRVRRVRARARQETAEPYQRPRAATTKGHGTDARYRAHLRRGETPCLECTDAHNEISRMQKAAKRAAS